MVTSLVSLDCDRITDWPSFHDECARVFGFPDFYGRNLDAWVDCMTSLDVPEDMMSSVHCARGSVLTIELRNARAFRKRCPEQFDAIVKCSKFVNERRVAVGETPVLAVSFDLGNRGWIAAFAQGIRGFFAYGSE